MFIMMRSLVVFFAVMSVTLTAAQTTPKLIPLEGKLLPGLQNSMEVRTVIGEKGNPANFLNCAVDSNGDKPTAEKGTAGLTPPYFYRPDCRPSPKVSRAILAADNRLSARRLVKKTPDVAVSSSITIMQYQALSQQYRGLELDLTAVRGQLVQVTQDLNHARDEVKEAKQASFEAMVAIAKLQEQINRVADQSRMVIVLPILSAVVTALCLLPIFLWFSRKKVALLRENHDLLQSGRQQAGEKDCQPTEGMLRPFSLSMGLGGTDRPFAPRQPEVFRSGPAVSALAVAVGSQSKTVAETNAPLGPALVLRPAVQNRASATLDQDPTATAVTTDRLQELWKEVSIVLAKGENRKRFGHPIVLCEDEQITVEGDPDFDLEGLGQFLTGLGGSLVEVARSGNVWTLTVR